MKCHGASGVHSEGTAESSGAPMLFQNTHHRALRVMRTTVVIQWVTTFSVTPVSCTVGVLSYQAQPKWNEATQTKTCTCPVPVNHPPPPAQAHLSVHGGRQQNRQHPGTFQALAPLHSHQTAPLLAIVVASHSRPCVWSQQGCGWAGGIKKPFHIPVVSPPSLWKWGGGKGAKGLQILLLPRHPEGLKDRRKNEIAVTSSVLGKMSFWVQPVATSHLPTEMKALFVVTALTHPFFPH